MMQRMGAMPAQAQGQAMGRMLAPPQQDALEPTADAMMGSPGPLMKNPEGMPNMPQPQGGSNMPQMAPQEPNEGQAMMDAAFVAVNLRSMSEKQRMKVWPSVAGRLVQEHPSLEAFVDPKSAAPSDDALDRLLRRGHYAVASTMKEPTSEELMSSSVAGPAEGTGVKPLDLFGGEGDKPKKKSPYLKLHKTVQKEVQDRLIEMDTDMKDLSDIHDNFDADAFTYKGQVKEFIAEKKDRAGMADERDQELLGGRIQQRQRIERMMLIWRKYITGVAGGEKEMERIEKTTLNADMSPAQAKAAMGLLTMRTMRDREAYRKLLIKGILKDVTNSKEYTSEFTKARTEVDKDHSDYISRFKEANPGATDVDALRFRETKMQAQQQAEEAE